MTVYNLRGAGLNVMVRISLPIEPMAPKFEEVRFDSA